MEAFLPMMRAQTGRFPQHDFSLCRQFAGDIRLSSYAPHNVSLVLTSKPGSVLCRSRGERPCGKLRRPQIVLSQALYAVSCRRRIARRRSRPAYRWRQGKAEAYPQHCRLPRWTFFLPQPIEERLNHQPQPGAAWRSSSGLPARTPLRNGVTRLGTREPSPQRASGRQDDAARQGQRRARAHPAPEPESAR